MEDYDGQIHDGHNNDGLTLSCQCVRLIDLLYSFTTCFNKSTAKLLLYVFIILSSLKLNQFSRDGDACCTD